MYFQISFLHEIGSKLSLEQSYVKILEMGFGVKSSALFSDVLILISFAVIRTQNISGGC